jgi:alpha-tubulin suppressor-like RCC1 family protein
LFVQLAQALPTKLGDLDADGQPTVLDLQRLINYLNGDSSGLPPLPPGLTQQEREAFLDMDQSGTIDQRDVDALADAILGRTTLFDFPATRLIEVSPANGEEMVSPARTIILRFSRRIQPATISRNSVYLIANNERVPGRIEVSSTATFATFFPSNSLPASTEIRVVVDGNLIRDVYGLPIAADPSLNSQPSSLNQLPTAFRTLPLFRIPGTAVSGYVFDSYRTNADGSPVPIIGATIRVDAFPEANAVTDERGYFTLTNVPAPSFFVHIDGSTAINAPPGFEYPSGGKLFHSVPGRSTVMPPAFNIYLPPMALADAAPLRTNVLTDVFFGPEGIAQLQRMFPTNDVAMFQKVCVRFPPRSAQDDAGRLATTGTIIPVPPDRIPSPLPPNLNPRLVISVQAMLPDGAAATRFDVPAPVIFPNLDGLAPGEKALFFSFNHAAGRWDVIGAGTATTNGTIETDADVGIRAPGWHFVQVGTTAPGKPCIPNAPCVVIEGRLGDIIKVDLNLALPEDADGVRAKARDWEIVDVRTLDGGTFAENEDGTLLASETGDKPFSETGVLFFIPGIATPSRSQTELGEGTMLAELRFGAILINRHGNENEPEPGLLQIKVEKGFSDSISSDTSTRLHTYKIQQRLRYFGFPDSMGNWLGVDGGIDVRTKWAIGLFNAAVADTDHQSSAAIELPSAINARIAPRWLELPSSGQGWSNDDEASDNQDWGTSWAVEVIKEAGGRNRSGTPILINDISKKKGGDTDHDDHEAGRDIDVRLVVPPGVWYDIGRAAVHLNTGAAFWNTVSSLSGGILTPAAARAGIAIGGNFTTAYDRDPNGWRLDRTIDNLYAVRGNQNDPYQIAIRSLAPGGPMPGESGLSVFDRGFNELIPSRTGYDRTATVLQIHSLSGSSVNRVIFNDPVARRLLTTFDAFPLLSPVAFPLVRDEGHAHHFHVDVALPAQPVGPLPAPASPVPISTAPGFGSDTRLYYRFQLANGFEIAGRSSVAGTFTEVLSPNTDYTLTLYRPADNRWAVYRGRSNASGQVTDLATFILDQFGGPDTDGDGLPDQGEYAIGTLPGSPDSDEDGLTDDAELTQGLNPNNRAAFPTGVISSLPLRGEAKEVVVDENLAYVATGSYGLAIVDVSQFNNPIILGQVDLPGDATDVAVAPMLDYALVATGTNGIAIVDVSDPMMPRLVRAIPLLGTRTEMVLTMAYIAVGTSLVSVDLLTGQILQSVDLGGGVITDIAQEGSFLYTMQAPFDSRRYLSVIELGALSNSTMMVRGSLDLGCGGGRFFVGGGIAYVPAAADPNCGRGGFSTVNVSNPSNLLLISSPDVVPPFIRPGLMVVPNGSGLSLLAGSAFGRPQLNIMDTRDLSNTDSNLVEIALSDVPTCVVIGSGIGFLAEGSVGLQVVNYLPFDNRGAPPTVALAANFSLSPAQVEEGKAARVAALTTDDMQVRDVEFFIDGVSVARDVSFPFEYRFVTPSVTTNRTNFTMRAKATDTGGNIAWTEEFTIRLAAELIPPHVVRVFPQTNSVSWEVGIDRVVCYFNEPLSLDSLNSSTVKLRSAGPDDALGTADDFTLTNGTVQYYAELNAAVLEFSSPLSKGLYEAETLRGVTDRAGNALSSDFRWQFWFVETTTITGTLVDTNGMPVAGATVTVYKWNLSAQTDSDGRFTLEQVPVGPWPLALTIELFRDGQRFLTVLRDPPLVPGGVTLFNNVVLRPLFLTRQPRLAAGRVHSVALRTDGSLWTWGSNEEGQLGGGPFGANGLVPFRVGTNTNWQAVAAGDYHTLAIQNDGTLWSWGEWADGQLGRGGFSNSALPVMTNATWVEVAAGSSHTVALRSDGILWAWGNNALGQLGDGTTDTRFSPVPVVTNMTWLAMAAGQLRTFAVRSDGSLWAWGGNHNGELGDGTTIHRVKPVPIGTNANWQAVAAGANHTVALQADGTLWAWGTNQFGQLGDGTTTARLTPTQIGTNKNWEAVAAGTYYTVALRADGTLWAWGNNSTGQLGDETAGTNRYSPVPIGTNGIWMAVAAGSDHTLALRDDGTLWAWGSNSSGEFGDGTSRNIRSRPQQVGNKTNWQAVSVGGQQGHAMGLTSDGALWAWGYNYSGQLGDGTTIHRLSSVRIGANETWLSMGAGVGYSLAIKSDGSLWAWGANEYGQLGIGTNDSELHASPVRIASHATWQSVSETDTWHSGLYRNYVQRNDGTLWGWGYNQLGQLGDGTIPAPGQIVYQFTLVPVGTNANWRAVLASVIHTIGVQSGGTLWAWGRVYLSDGSGTDWINPVQIATNATWKAVAAGWDHTVGLRSDDTLWAWGRNFYGALGDGTTSNRFSPVQIGTNSTWLAVAASEYHAVAVRSDRSLWGWGHNNYGQVGDGTTTDRFRPVAIDTNSTWRGVAAGPDRTFAIREDGSLWAWGYAYVGALGFGSMFQVLGGAVWGLPP